MWKNEKFIKLFQQEINNVFKTTTLDINDLQNEILWFHDILKQCAKNAYSQCEAGHHIFKGKPWWSNDLTYLKRRLSLFFNLWRNDGFSYDSTNVYYNRYKLAQSIFRKEIKKLKITILLNTTSI